MMIFHLYRTSERIYDTMMAMVVRAANELDARSLARENCGESEAAAHDWDQADVTKCVIIGKAPYGDFEPEVICSDFIEP